MEQPGTFGDVPIKGIDQDLPIPSIRNKNIPSNYMNIDGGNFTAGKN